MYIYIPLLWSYIYSLIFTFKNSIELKFGKKNHLTAFLPFLTKKYSIFIDLTTDLTHIWNQENAIIRNHAHIGLKNCSLEAELDEAAQGTGLAFIVMADVFTKVLNMINTQDWVVCKRGCLILSYLNWHLKIPGAPIWSCLFFCMLLSLGLGSQIGIMEVEMLPLFSFI